ncbi:hypothetical protein MUB24_17005 [Lederbergia sp. NSJ-179]|uniref:hypothetical protein n=1 Tax=Lederbergia sp. NSJ-179 TaxID=2931402 RepID=UPI001FD4DCDD|nr:hypothetical protein [Lederbergia sp. NSJ-179]MCJ7842564.1 hypothetical protein [Lederbergia sp. NSJ-179]
MSLTETTLFDVVMKQYAFKRRAFFTTFGTLALLQLLGLLFSIGGSGGSGFLSENMSIDLTYYSGDIVIVFTILWTFIAAIFMTTKAARYDDYTFVANLLSSHLANLLFLLTACIIGGISAVLCGYLVRIFGYFSDGLTMGVGLFSAPLEFVLSVSAVTLYGLLFATLGYLFGTTIQLHRSFMFLLPALFVGAMIAGVVSGHDDKVKAIFDFIFLESHFWLFFVKVILVSGVFFTVAVGLSNKMEVRK